jgi:serine/threonine protein kinase
VTNCGSRFFTAPEVARGVLKDLPELAKDRADIAYGTPADVWSVGIVAFEALYGGYILNQAKSKNVGKFAKGAISYFIPQPRS